MARQFDSDGTSLDLLNTITSGLDFSIPNVDFDGPFFHIPDNLKNIIADPADKLKTEDITVRKVGGSGIFDAFMESYSVHIKEEYDEGRITGAEYTKAYVALAQAAMQFAVQFALGKDQAYWNAISAQVNAQLGAIGAYVNTANAKVQLAIAKSQVHQNKAQYAATVEQLAIADAQYANALEQMEATRAQTLDRRTDGVVVVGSIGKQKDLYSKQIWAYEREAEYKAAQIWSNAWISQKGIDEGLAAPGQLQNAAVDSMLQQLRSKLGIY